MRRRNLVIRLLALAVTWLTLSAAHAATVTVNSTADTLAANDGAVTFREAITAINAGNDLGDPNITAQSPGTFGTNDTINFNIPGSAVQVITVTSTLPTITKPVTINGYSQLGSSPNTNPFPGPLNTVLKIELSGAYLSINASNVTVRGLVFANGVDEIEVLSGNNVTIAGNFIGTDATGTAATGLATGGFGMRLDNGNNHLVGGPAPADRNLISGNRQGGIFVGIGTTDSVRIEGNYIGTDIDGSVQLIPVAIGTGITIRGAATNAQIVNNLISGNPDGGIEDDSTGGLVQGNLIGVGADGTSAIPNGNFGGLILNYGGSGNGGITVGGGGAGQPNVIAKNNGFGVIVYTNNNNIQQNSIYANTLKDISLNQISGAVVANDSCDVDSTPGNLRQNYPVLTSVSVASGNVTLSGTLNSAASTSFRVELYSTDACSPSGNGGGKTFLGAITVPTDGSCNGAFGPVVLPVPVGEGVFTATATDPAGNTSEFSACKSVSVQTASSTTLGSSVNPSSSGQSVTFTATVTGASPTGTVQFKDNGVNLGAAATLVAGVATLNTSSLGVGTHPITAVYAGDANNTGSTSNTVNQQVNAVAGATSTALGSSQNPAPFGTSVTFTATVTGSSPTGTVQFMDAGSPLGSPVTLSGGVATFATSALGAGSHSITAVYGGDASNQGSTSPVLSQFISAPGGGGGTSTPALVPTLSDWGVMLLTLLLAGAAGLVLRRRGRPR